MNSPVTIVDVTFFIINTTRGFFPSKLHDSPIPKDALIRHIRGRLRDIRNYYGANLYAESTMYLAYDAPPYVRAREFPEYKAGRKRRTSVEEEMEEIGHEVCADCDFATPLYVIGLEADDVIHNVVRQTAEIAPGTKISIFSKDSDMLPLLTVPDVDVKFTWFDGSAITKDSAPPKNVNGVRYEDILQYFALTGGHNNLPKLLPPMKAKKLIEEGTLNSYLDMFPVVKSAYEWNLELATPIDYDVI